MEIICAMTWQTGLAELMRILAMLCIGAGMANLFHCRETVFIGPARWLVLGILAAFLMLHCGIFLAWLAGFALAPGPADLLSGASILVIGISQGWFLLHVKARMRRAMGPSLKRRFDSADAALFEAKSSLELAEEIAHVGYWRYDLNGKRLSWSDEIYRIHGVTKRDFTPSLEAAISAYHKDDQAAFARAFWNAVFCKTSFDISARLIRAGGEVRHVRSRGVAQVDADGDVSSVFSVCIDITEQQQIEAALRRANALAEKANQVLHAMALVDSLTALPNRRQFGAALVAECRRAARAGTRLGMIMIDLDHFKGYNDLFGHPAGDDCLRNVASAIRGALLRPGDFAARYGGEELAVLLPATDFTGAEMVAGQIAQAVRALRLPHPATPAGIVTVSCGVAVYDPETDAHDPVKLVSRADQALYRAKLGGRNRIVCESAFSAEVLP
jgi:diguanylate cyclase (GGDEF)-like protein/PAS domain S-box-containing protein